MTDKALPERNALKMVLRDSWERLVAERDRARSIAVALEQQLAEALRLASEALDGVGGSNALARFEDVLEDIQRVLGAGDD